MFIAVPDYNFVLKKMNGHLFPFGLLKFLFYKSKIKAMRVMIMGVIKEYRNRGIEGAFIHMVLPKTLKRGITKCEFSWILEDNVMVQRTCESVGGKVYKKYRVYEKML